MLVTHWVLIGLSVALVVWDIYLAVKPPTGDTISEVITRTAKKHMMIPFALGVLMGHWLW